jgi:hypothetical protein
MGWISIHAGMPHCRDYDFWCADRELEGGEALHLLVGTAKRGARHERNQVRMARDADSIGEAGDDRDDFSPKP